ncbi:MAG: archease [Chloroflexi bacterium]|nr:archease [Chloroflexota bacterium]
MGDFQLIDHTADVGISATGRNLEEAFASVAEGMFSIIVELEDVAEDECHEVQVNAPDIESLLVAWLNELLYLFDAEGIVFKRFQVSDLTERSLKALCWGEQANSKRHRFKAGVKSATYHMLRVESNGIAKVQVILDI